MKTITLAILILFFSYPLFAQNPIYDALFLIDKINSSGKIILQHDVQEMLVKYFPVDSPDSITAVMVNANPFFKSLFRDKGADAEDVSSLSEGMKSISRGGIGNLNVTSFADGLAKFLVARAKEELNVAFFRKFQDFLKGYPEVQVIFPATYDLVSQIYSYQYAAFLPALRSAFHRDMNTFSTNLMKLRELDTMDCPSTDKKCRCRLNSIHQFLHDDPIGRTFVAGLLVSDNLIKGNNAVEILDNLANDELFFEETDNFSSSIRFCHLLSNALRSKEEGELWVNKNQINTLIGNKHALKIFLGLFYATNQQLPVPVLFHTASGETIPLDNLLQDLVVDTSDQFFRFKTSLQGFGYLAADVSLGTRNIKLQDDPNGEASLLRYADYASALSSLLTMGVSFFNTENTQLAKDVGLFTAVLDNAVASCYDVKSKNYSSLVLHTSVILDTILAGQYSFRSDYIRYGNFMANIIEADNSDEVKAAIEAAVLPVGSSSIKRETFSNISLNAYLGLMGGMEYLPGLQEGQTAPVVGVTAPLGLAFSWGNIGNGRRNHSLTKEQLIKKSKKGGQSLSLFIPLIDVGALATFRFGDDSSHVASEVKLANIIAPGLYGYWGLGKGPISIGLGAQMGPQLRKINAEDVNVDKNFYIRYSLTIAVDIPFFNFYTRN